MQFPKGAGSPVLSLKGGGGGEGGTCRHCSVVSTERAM